MKCIIVDDDELSRRVIKQCIERSEFLELLAECSGGREALEYTESNKVDLIFLDIEMPEMSGLEFIKASKCVPQVILVTGKKEYAAEAFDYDVTDFLLKPLDYQRFQKAVNKAKEIHESVRAEDENGIDLFFIKVNSRLVKLDLEDVLWVEALADYVNIYTSQQRYTVLSTMKSIESRLPSKDFFRIHRSHIINLNKIKEIEDNSVVINGEVLSIGRSYKEDLFKRLKLN